MKRYMVTAALLALLLAGCGSADTGMETARNRTEKLIQSASEAVERTVTETSVAAESTGTLLTGEEAQAIALKHAGLTAEQVSALRTEYEVDDGRPEYEVEFRYETWEYHYEIDARSGKIVSWDRDA